MNFWTFLDRNIGAFMIAAIVVAYLVFFLGVPRRGCNVSIGTTPPVVPAPSAAPAGSN
jgi:hypothetical protein